RIQKLSATGTPLASVTIPRFFDAKHEEAEDVWGVAVDHSQGRVYVLQGGPKSGKTGTIVAKNVFVYSITPNAGKLVAPEGGPVSFALPTEAAKQITLPNGIAVDPTTHEVEIMGETSSKIVFVRFNSTTGAEVARFSDASSKLKPVGKTAT